MAFDEQIERLTLKLNKINLEFMDALVMNAARDGKKIVTDNVSTSEIKNFPSNLVNDLKVEKVDNCHYQIIANNQTFVYLEYGTGVAGDGKLHQITNATGVIYDKNSKGEDGWLFTPDDSDKNPCKCINEADETIVCIKGRGSRPFMYDAVLELEKKLPKIFEQQYGSKND